MKIATMVSRHFTILFKVRVLIISNPKKCGKTSKPEDFLRIIELVSEHEHDASSTESPRFGTCFMGQNLVNKHGHHFPAETMSMRSTPIKIRRASRFYTGVNDLHAL